MYNSKRYVAVFGRSTESMGSGCLVAVFALASPLASRSATMASSPPAGCTSPRERPGRGKKDLGAEELLALPLGWILALDLFGCFFLAGGGRGHV